MAGPRRAARPAGAPRDRATAASQRLVHAVDRLGRSRCRARLAHGVSDEPRPQVIEPACTALSGNRASTSAASSSRSRDELRCPVLIGRVRRSRSAHAAITLQLPDQRALGRAERVRGLAPVGLTGTGSSESQPRSRSGPRSRRRAAGAPAPCPGSGPRARGGDSRTAPSPASRAMRLRRPAVQEPLGIDDQLCQACAG